MQFIFFGFFRLGISGTLAAVPCDPGWGGGGRAASAGGVGLHPVSVLPALSNTVA